MRLSAGTAHDNRAAVRHLGGQAAVVMGGTAFTFLVGLPFQVYLARGLGTEGRVQEGPRRRDGQESDEDGRGASPRAHGPSLP